MLGLIGLGLTGCDAPVDSTSQTTSSSTSSPSAVQPASATTSTSATTTSVTQKYVYALIGGKVNNFPIDNTTGALISRTSGGVLTSVSQTIPSFQYMVLDGSGNYMYALASTGMIWIFSVQSNYAYNQFSSSNALTYLDNSKGIVYGNALNWGSNGHLFLRSNTGSIYAYEYSQNSATGLLTDLSTTPPMLASQAVSNYSVNWNSNTTSVTNGMDTYTIDTQTNTILHYQNGVLQGSTSGYSSGTFQSLLLK